MDSRQVAMVHSQVRGPNPAVTGLRQAAMGPRQGAMISSVVAPLEDMGARQQEGAVAMAAREAVVAVAAMVVEEEVVVAMEVAVVVGTVAVTVEGTVVVEGAVVAEVDLAVVVEEDSTNSVVGVVEAATGAEIRSSRRPRTQSSSVGCGTQSVRMISWPTLAALELSRWTSVQTNQRSGSTKTRTVGYLKGRLLSLMMIQRRQRLQSAGSVIKISKETTSKCR